MAAFASRIVNLILGLYRLFVLTVVGAVVGLAAMGYLAYTGDNLWIVHRAVSGLGKLLAGQRLERLAIAAELLPSTARLEASASVDIRVTAERRHRFFLLLNPGLEVTQTSVRVAGAPAEGRYYRVWSLLVVEVDRDLDRDEVATITLTYEGTPTATAFGGANAIAGEEIVLDPTTFWYPGDAQGFFTLEAAITAPAHLAVVHGGVDRGQSAVGGRLQTRWASERPVAGLALVVGRYSNDEMDLDGIRYRVHLAEDVHLDPARLLAAMGRANRTLTQAFGDSGFPQLTFFVTRKIRRAFNDGSGLVGTSIRYFRAGDYGFALMAHEIGHNWWGATVTEKWLTPESGGQWIVEGFANLASWLATEKELGQPWRARVMQRDFFDPDRQGVIEAMTSLDNGLAEATARDTIYRKGGYVAWMLGDHLGGQAYLAALRAFLEQHRFEQVSASDLQLFLEQSTGQDLKAFFDDWLRSRALADLTFRKNDDGTLTLTNTGTARISAPIEVLTRAADGSAPLVSEAHVGDQIQPPPVGGLMVLDPWLRIADVHRGNNRFPEAISPRIVAAHGSANMLIAKGDPYPWSRTLLTLQSSAGTEPHTWDLERGLLQAPRWSADGQFAVLSQSDPTQLTPQIVRLSIDGTRRRIGAGDSPTVSATGTIYAARGDRILAFDSRGKRSVLTTRAGWTVADTQLSPDDRWLAYTVARANDLELHAMEVATGRDQRLMACDRDRIALAWSRDSSEIYVGRGTDATWRVIALRAQGEPAERVLADGFTSLADLQVSPDGKRLAISGATDDKDTAPRQPIFVLGLEDRQVQRFESDTDSYGSLSWEDDGHIVAVATGVAAIQDEGFPLPSRLVRLSLSDGSVTPVAE